MIVTRKACQCAFCRHEWLANKTKDNPTADPRKVKRCASCKSGHWNSDDPKVIEAKLAKVPIPEVPAAAVEYSNRLIQMAQTISSVGPAHLATCRHRVLLAQCGLCNPPRAEVNA